MSLPVRSLDQWLLKFISIIIINTVMPHYHYHMDPNLGEVKFALAYIHYAYVARVYPFDHTCITGCKDSQQPRCLFLSKIKYNYILGHYNDWVIMSYGMNSSRHEK